MPHHIERITFVSDDLDQGREVTDWLIAHVSDFGACAHEIHQAFFSVMQEAGVRRMVCPSCGCRCTVPQIQQHLDGTEDD